MEDSNHLNCQISTFSEGNVPPTPSILTNNRQDDHHYVEYVPPVGEVVMAQGKELQHKLCGEDHDEDKVDPVQD